MTLEVLDLFSAAAGGWSLGMHRAGYRTIAACENVEWRRVLYAQNNPGVLIYDDVRTLTADRIVSDIGYLPDIVVGSPPCQDISPANTKGKSIEGERSGLYFEAIRVIGEVRPRWFALENSANLRTRGADAVLAALEGIDYACWPFVVRAGDVGANHERPRSWLIGCDIAQVTDADGLGWHEGREGRRSGVDLSVSQDTGHADSDAVRITELSGRPKPQASAIGDDAVHATSFGHEGGWPRRHGPEGDGAPPVAEGAGSAPYTDQAGQADGPLVTGLRQVEVSDDGRGAGRGAVGECPGEVGLCEADRLHALKHRAGWSLDDLADHLRLDARLSAWVADTRIAVGGTRGTSAASLIVEAFGDSVVPQIPEAIGRAILRTELALSAIFGERAV